MNKSIVTVSRQFIIALGFLGSTCFSIAQKQTKTYTESFNVGKDAVLEINTSYSDIEFETWNQDKVMVTATFELEGATEEEAKEYYASTPVEIMGNSRKVSITSKSQRMGLFPGREFNFDMGDFDMDIPEVSAFMVEMPEIGPLPEMVEMPPLPMTKAFRFDYDAYKKDGEVYMKKWQKNFEKSFDKKHQKRLEEWGEKMEKRAEKLQQHLEEPSQQMEANEKKRSELLGKREKVLLNRSTVLDSLLVKKDSLRNFLLRTVSIKSGPTIFYSSTNGEKKKYKVKKVIKIKMPKGMRIQMNVRHGEVKLAENVKNLNATLSHASLQASTIDGNETKVSASYTPVSVQTWNHGQLYANYSRNVSLAKVMNLQLSATSSDVTIDEISGKAFIKSDFGPLVIKSVGNSFEELDLSLKNGELRLSLPNSPAAMYVKGTNSDLSTPAGLLLATTTNGNTTIHKGNHMNNKGSATIHITSEYSDIIIR